MLLFMSSDSGSAGDFRAFEDGSATRVPSCLPGIKVIHSFAAYAASKAALNQMLRVSGHFGIRIALVEEHCSIWRPNCKGKVALPLCSRCILVKLQRRFQFPMFRRITLMISCRDILGDESVGWEVEGIISAEYSVNAMLRVIATTSSKDTGKFLTWEGRVESKQLPHTLPSITDIV